MTLTRQDRTRKLKETVSELLPVEIFQRMDLGGKFSKKTLSIFDKPCDHLVANSIEQLWIEYGSRDGKVFAELMAFREYLIAYFLKPRIQFIRDEFDRIGVTPRPITLKDIKKNALPIFHVEQHFHEIIVQGNLFKKIGAPKNAQYRPHTFRTDPEVLIKLLDKLPTGIGEDAFWEAVWAHEVIQEIQQKISEKYSSFQSDSYWKERRKTAAKISIHAGKYAGRSGFLVENRGSQSQVEIEIESGKWLQARLPTSSVKVLK